jgi:excisionase family DNA binding protein
MMCRPKLLNKRYGNQHYWTGRNMKTTPDTQLINALAAAIEPVVERAVEKAVKEVFLGNSTAQLSKTIEKTARDVSKEHPPAYQSPQEIENRLLTVKEVAAFLSIGKSTVWSMVQRGDLKAVRFGRNTRFWLADVEGLVGKAENGSNR